MKQSEFHKIEGEAATVSEALRLTGLDTPVVSEALYGASTMDPIDGFKRISYQGAPETLAVTKDRYAIVQNSDALGIVDDVLGAEAGVISTVGQTDHGARLFIQAKMPHSFEALRGDHCDTFLTVSTSHDGKGSVRAFFTARRAFCQNQMSAIQKGKWSTGRSIAIPHKGNATERVKLAHKILMEGSTIWEEMREFAEILTRKSNNRERTKKFLEGLFPSDPNAKRDHNAPKREAIAHLIENGRGNTGETAWDLFNGATEWFDHQSPVRGGTDRTVRSILGGDAFRAKAAELALNI